MALVSVTGAVTADQFPELPRKATLKLAALIENETEARGRQFLAESLVRIARVLSPTEAATVFGRTANHS